MIFCINKPAKLLSGPKNNKAAGKEIAIVSIGTIEKAIKSEQCESINFSILDAKYTETIAGIMA